MSIIYYHMSNPLGWHMNPAYEPLQSLEISSLFENLDSPDFEIGSCKGGAALVNLYLNQPAAGGTILASKLFLKKYPHFLTRGIVRGRPVFLVLLLVYN